MKDHSCRELYDLAVLGHLTIDRIQRGDRYRDLPGGPPYYTSIAGQIMGLNTGVITKVGRDYPESYLGKLKSYGIGLSMLYVVDQPTTSFEIIYRNDRRLRLLRKCTDFTFSDLTHQQKARCLHLGSVAGEVPVEVALHAIEKADFTSLDVQGFIRGFDRKGNVMLRSGVNKVLASKVGLFKCSLEEAEAITGSSDPEHALNKLSNLGAGIIVITAGDRGAYMAADGKYYKASTYPPVTVNDTTGAGDVFVGAFLAGTIKQNDNLWCFSLALATSSLVVEKTDSLNMGLERKTIESRSEWVYSKIHRL